MMNMDQEQTERERLGRKEVEDQDFADINLRQVELSDVDDFMEWLTDEKVSKFCSWDTYPSREAAMEYLIEQVIPHPWYRAICIKDKPVGSISISPFHGNNSCRAELGYVLASKYWGKGIVTKAVKMAALNIFVEWPNLERLEALVDVDNIGSQKVMEKSGFIKEGVLRKFWIHKGKSKDMVMYSLLSTDSQINYFIYD